MKHAIVVALLCLAHVASADPPSVLVLRAEGTADAASRTSVDSNVLRLARSIDGKVDAGEITLTEAAALVGCNPSDAACKDEVLTTLGVDEVVTTTVTATPTGLNITVRRIARGASRAAQTTIPAGRAVDGKLDADIAPLFGAVAAAPVAPAVVDKAPVVDNPPVEPAPAPTPPPPAGDDTSTAPIGTAVTAAPTGTIAPMADEGDRRTRRFAKIGLGVSGGLVLLSFLMWSQANDIQSQIDDKPEPRTQADFEALRDLEKKGDDMAGVGNVFFLAGMIGGGVSAYYFWKSGRSSTQTARIAPAAYPQGAGVTLTIGGLP